MEIEQFLNEVQTDNRLYSLVKNAYPVSYTPREVYIWIRLANERSNNAQLALSRNKNLSEGTISRIECLISGTAKRIAEVTNHVTYLENRG